MLRFLLAAVVLLVLGARTASATDVCPPEQSTAGCAACDATETACDCVDCDCENCTCTTEVLTPRGEKSTVVRRVFLSGGPIRNGVAAVLEKKPLRTGLARVGRGAAKVVSLPFKAAKHWRQAAKQRRSSRRCN